MHLPLLQVTARTDVLHDLEERSKALAALQAELSAERARLAEVRSSLEGEQAQQAQLASQVAADKASLERSRLSMVEREAELRRKQHESAEATKVGPFCMRGKWSLPSASTQVAGTHCLNCSGSSLGGPKQAR